MGADKLVELAKSRKWMYAKTMPKFPHKYTIREWVPDRQQEFAEAALFIREPGNIEPFLFKIHIYYSVDGWKNWTMGNPIP